MNEPLRGFLKRKDWKKEHQWKSIVFFLSFVVNFNEFTLNRLACQHATFISSCGHPKESAEDGAVTDLFQEIINNRDVYSCWRGILHRCWYMLVLHKHYFSLWGGERSGGHFSTSFSNIQPWLSDGWVSVLLKNASSSLDECTSCFETRFIFCFASVCSKWALAQRRQPPVQVWSKRAVSSAW